MAMPASIVTTSVRVAFRMRTEVDVRPAGKARRVAESEMTVGHRGRA